VINHRPLSVCFNGHFPGEPELAGVYWSNGWRRWCDGDNWITGAISWPFFSSESRLGTRMSSFWLLLELRMMEVVSGDNWSYKRCKAPVKSSPPTNQHPVFYRPDALPVAQPIESKHWRKNITFHGLAYPKLTWGSSNFSLTINSSWLPWVKVAMPLIIPLMPVPHDKPPSYPSYTCKDILWQQVMQLLHFHFRNQNRTRKGTGGKTWCLPGFLGEYGGKDPGCPSGVGAYGVDQWY